MYIPKINAYTNQNEIIAFMKQFSFATIITAKDNLPIATHLPFIVRIKDDKIILSSHFAKANEQWQHIESNQVLVIFSEPHAYISTKNYDTELNVPTWNYVAVHAYGHGKIITEKSQVFEILEASINAFDASYKAQWDKLPEDYKLNNAEGIIAFEIIINDLQAKKKLSQNRSETEKQKIIASLSNSKDTNKKLIAEFMKKE